MSAVVINGDVSGSVTLQAPSAAGTTTLTLPATSGTVITTASTTGVNGSAISSGVVAEAYGGTGTTIGHNAFKNRIINGAIGIWQRGTSGTAAGYAYASADRWAGMPFSSYQVLSQSTSVPTGISQYSLKVQRTAAQTNTGVVGVMQTIESTNCYDLSSQTITLSFWAKAGANFSSGTSQIGVQFITGTTADQGGSTYYAWAGQGNVIGSNATLTTTWTKYTFTGTCGAGVLEAAALFFFTPTGTAGADDSFYITGVQLEKGSTATSFDYRPYGTELALCQRYYQRFIAGGAYTAFGLSVLCSGATSSTGTLKFDTTMRTTPSAMDSSAASTFMMTDGTNNTACTSVGFAAVQSNEKLAQINFGTAGGLTQYRPYNATANNNASSYIGFTAEL